MSSSSRVMMATTPYIPGHEIVEYKGLAWGITVRCKNLVIDYLAGWRTIFGGEVGGYSRLAQEARQQAVDRMISAARRQGANAIIEVCFDSQMANTQQTGNNQGASNAVTAYGTAVVVRPV